MNQAAAIKAPVKVCISEADYSKFKQDFGFRKFPGQRFGQAFYEHFKLGEHEPNMEFDRIHACEDMGATIKMIRGAFEFTGSIPA